MKRWIKSSNCFRIKLEFLAATMRQRREQSTMKPLSKPPRSPGIGDTDENNRHTKKPWYEKIQWLNSTTLVIVPFLAFIQTPFVPLHRNTLIWAGLYYTMTAGSITAGYHRLWAHRAYQASTPFKLALALLGGGAIQGSIKFWAREHRAHHRYTDTEKDPYNIKQGLLHAHILWLLLKQPKKSNRVDISDLNNDPIVIWQHRNFIWVALIMGWLFPAFIAGIFWGDWYGGFLYAGLIRLFLVNQATFCVNSLAHYLGDQPFDDRRSPRNHHFTAIITMGEGYHNFHHEFPSDYRNGVMWYQIDVTKWFIYIFEFCGLAHSLKRFRQNEIEKGHIQQQYKKLDDKSQWLDWGPDLSLLPILTWKEYLAKVRQGQDLIVIEGVVHDVSNFIEEHPGGRTMIRSAIGKDGSTFFNGGIYDHSNAARNFLSTLRVAVIRGGGEIEVEK